MDARSDLFSLGVVLYQMATGQIPFRGDGTLAILTALVKDTPTPAQLLNPAVPGPLAALMMQLLEKDRKERPTSARKVADRLQGIERQLLAEPGNNSLPVTASRLQARVRRTLGSHRGLVVAAVALLLLSPVAYFFGGQVIRFATNHGQIVIEVDDSEAVVTVKENGAIIQDRQGQREITLTAGHHDLDVTIKDSAGETHFFSQKLTLKRGGKEIINARQEWAQAGGDERMAAECALSLGGRIVIRVPGKDQEQDIDAIAMLPTGAFQLLQIHLGERPGVTDAGLMRLKDLMSLTHLYLWRTGVTDKGLVQLKGLTSLTHLVLGSSGVTDRGLGHLKDLTNLTHLNLANTPVTDAGLEHLKGMTKLTVLSLSGYAKLFWHKWPENPEKNRASLSKKFCGLT